MVFTCSRITRFQVLFILAVRLFTQVLCQPADIKVKEVGSSITYICPGDLTSNYTFKFYQKSFFAQPKLIQPDAKNKLRGNILVKSGLTFGDSARYSCSVFDQSGTKIKEHSFGVLSIIPVQTIKFEMTKPKSQTSLVDRDVSFEFECEYSKPKTQFIWERRRLLNNESVVTDKLPREAITVVPDDSKSIEVYSIKRVTKQDAATYRCQVSEDGRIRSTHARVLQVRDNQLPEIRVEKNRFFGEHNQHIYITLTVMGAPSPNISCYCNNRTILFCSGKVIENADLTVPKDEGVCSNGNYRMTGLHVFIISHALYSLNDGLYKCIASNIFGTDDVKFNVNITARPKIDRKQNRFFFAQENEDGRVVCKIEEANPTPNVRWFEQEPQSNSEPDKYKWLPSKLVSNLVPIIRAKYESVLMIPYNVQKKLYRCVATNKGGNDSIVLHYQRLGKRDKLFVVTSNSRVLNEGTRFIAKCRALKWIGEDIVFYRTDTQAVVENDNRTNLTITQDEKFRNLTMVISNLTLNDSGTYQCSKRSDNTNVTKQDAAANLFVKALRSPRIMDLKNKSAEYKEGFDDFVVLFCNVTGNPFPKITWTRSNGESPRASQTKSKCVHLKRGFFYKDNDRTKLTICKPSFEDTDSYKCTAENQLGSDSRNMHLYVSAKPKIKTPVLKTLKETLSAGKSYEISCVAEGNPVPIVQWILKEENRAMTNESKVFSTAYTSESILKINEMSQSYVGNYSCRARNSLGMVEEVFLELELEASEIIPKALPGSSGMATGTIVGIVVAVVVVVFVVCLFVILWYRRQQKKLLFYKHQYFLRTGDYTVDPSMTLNEQSMNLPYDSDWEFPFERLVLGDRLGAGAFGEVYKGEAMGILALNPRDKSSIANKRRSKIRRSLRASQRPRKKTIPPDLTNAVVAVKTVKAQATESEIRDLAAELKLMIHIGEHKNIVNLLGACTTGRKLYVVLEFCPHGNLLSFLRAKRDIYNSTWMKELYDPEKEFTLIDIIGAAFQVSKGMEFLAGRKLIHRDLAARNILVADGYVMKIADFGLARDIYNNDVYVKTSSGMLPVKWMAVESLFDRIYTHQSDVWSFGVLLWEMMTLGGTPYPNLPAEQLLDFLNEGKRMPQPAKCPLEVYTIMRDCWQEQAEDRPTFAKLVEHLGRILERHLEEANPYLHVEASPEEIEAAKERDELLKAKSDYYLQPMLMSKNIVGYDPNAPLPTPPTDFYNGATAPLPEVDTKPTASKMKEAGSYERLRDDAPTPNRIPLDEKSGNGLQEMNGRHTESEVQKVESVV